MDKDLMVMLAQLSDEQIKNILKARKGNDKLIGKLNKKRTALQKQIDDLDQQIASLKGGAAAKKAPKAKGKPGRKPAAKAEETTAAPKAKAKPGRKPAAVKAAPAPKAKGKPGRKPAAKIEVISAAPKAKGKPGRKPVAVKAVPAPKAKPAKKIAKGRKGSLTGLVRKILEAASAPLKASQIVDALPAAGYKVKDVAGIRKRVSVILASGKKSFEKTGSGLYIIKK